MDRFFPNISKIQFEGRDSKNPLSFKHYNPTELVGGKSMKDHLRFAACYWHTFCGTGSDPFGPGPQRLPWLTSADPIEQGKDKMDAAFEFFTKIVVFGLFF